MYCQVGLTETGLALNLLRQHFDKLCVTISPHQPPRTEAYNSDLNEFLILNF